MGKPYQSDSLPPVITVPPYAERYKLTTLKVLSRDESGRPEDCTMIPEDRPIEITGARDEDFIAVYVAEEMVEEK